MTPSGRGVAPARAAVPAARWSSWSATLTKAAAWAPPPVTTLVVCPHPDDEVLGCGGLILRQRACQAEVRVLAVTDGEAAYPGVVDADALATIRRGEQERALAELGVDRSHIQRLGIPDGSVACWEEELVERIATAGRDTQLVVAPWRHDHHGDHEASGRAAERAAARLGIPCVGTVFWGWHHRRPVDLAAWSLRALPLAPAEITRRRRALNVYRSQISDDLACRMLGPHELTPMDWPAEYLVVAPGP